MPRPASTGVIWAARSAGPVVAAVAEEEHA